jgi:hypothetical protein
MAKYEVGHAKPPKHSRFKPGVSRSFTSPIAVRHRR